MDNEDIYKLLIKFINKLFIQTDNHNNGRNSPTNTQVVQVTSSSLSSTVFITFLKEICDRLKKSKIIKDRAYTTFRDRCLKLDTVDNPCELVAINQLTDQFKILCDVMKTVLTANDMIPNPSSKTATRYDSDFIEISFIASGTFGSVYKARHRLDEQEYAIKKICVTREKYNKIIKILEEVKALAKLQHKNIILYKNAWIETSFSSDNIQTIPDSYEEESPASSKSHNNSSCNKSSKYTFSSLSISSSGEFVIRDDSEPGCSKSSVLNKRIVNDNSASKRNSAESIDSVVSFRTDCDNNSDSNNEERCEDNNFSSSSPTSDSDIEEIESDDAEKNSTEENNSNVQSHSQQVCEYKPRPDLLTLYIQMALCEQTLRKWLDERKNEVILVPTINEIYIQVLRGLQYIHFSGLVHHDIKPCNIFISTAKTLHVQIGDFGLACLPRKINGHDPVGTEMYAAPEQLNGSCDPKSDLYSFGIILMELIYPTKTFMELDNILGSLKRGEIPDTLEERYKKYGEVIIKLLVADPNERPSADMLLKEFETNKDFIIDRLELQIKEKNNDIQLLTDITIFLLNSMKKETNTSVRLKRLVDGMKAKHLGKK